MISLYARDLYVLGTALHPETVVYTTHPLRSVVDRGFISFSPQFLREAYSLTTTHGSDVFMINRRHIGSR
jgi:hypothetical protein